jgi:hypothetical protein
LTKKICFSGKKALTLQKFLEYQVAEMRYFLSFFLFLALTLATNGQQVIIVKAGDAGSLLDAVQTANQRNSSPQSPRLYVMIPDGCYDFGERVLTQITGHNIAFLGQSMRGTVIRNKPDKSQEGISKTAVFQNRGTGNYFQDLTLENALDYYSNRPDGRAVTLQDKGTRTICHRVCLLSHQDTYYSDNEHCQHYFSDSEIHGTVDFICGAGDVWFEHCRIVTEPRSLDPKNTNRNVIAAPRTDTTPWGYVFNRCTIENIKSPFHYARGWNKTPRCIWLHTTLLTPEKLLPTRFDERGMRTVESEFKEYETLDADGRVITPSSNQLTYVITNKEQRDGKEIVTERRRTAETILTGQEAARYTIANAFADWDPRSVIRSVEKKAHRLWKK